MAINKPENTAERYAKLREKDQEQKNNRDVSEKRTLLFNKKNFMFFGIGLLIVVVGFFFMSGGQMPDANTFDEAVIYSPMRITVAPFLVLAGLAVIIYGIFKDTGNANVEEPKDIL